jgi:hypothetical protein
MLRRKTRPEAPPADAVRNAPTSTGAVTGREVFGGMPGEGYDAATSARLVCRRSGTAHTSKHDEHLRYTNRSVRVPRTAVRIAHRGHGVREEASPAGLLLGSSIAGGEHYPSTSSVKANECQALAGEWTS